MLWDFSLPRRRSRLASIENGGVLTNPLLKARLNDSPARLRTGLAGVHLRRASRWGGSRSREEPTLVDSFPIPAGLSIHRRSPEGASSRTICCWLRNTTPVLCFTLRYGQSIIRSSMRGRSAVCSRPVKWELAKVRDLHRISPTIGTWDRGPAPEANGEFCEVRKNETL